MRALLPSLAALALLAGCTLAPPPREVPTNPNIGVGVDSPSSPLRLTVFSDFGCARCAELHRLLRELEPTYEGRLVVAFRDAITPAINPTAYETAMGARCAAEQGKGNAYTAAAFAYQGSWEEALPPDQLTTWAVEVQADVPRFSECMRDRRPADAIAADVADGRLLRIGRTPAIFLGSGQIADPGSPEEWKEMLDAAVHAIIRR